jgi:hypothetical protein
MNKFHKGKAAETSAEPIKTDAPFADDIQQACTGWFNQEFDAAKENMKVYRDNFAVYDDMIHCIRDKKNDYEPDIYLPEFTSRVLTYIGNFVAQYFGSRDYVETAGNYDDPRDIAEAKASKKLLNTILSDKDAHYFHKICRLLMFIEPNGFGVIKGGYNQRIEQDIVGYQPRTEYETNETGDILASDGTVYTDPYTQEPSAMTIQEPIFQPRIVKDKPIFDVYPLDRVYFDQSYAYSLQDKDYVYFETDYTLDQLYRDQDKFGYFNLERLRAKERLCEMDEAKKDYSVKGTAKVPDKKVSPSYTILERWGTWPVIVNERDDRARPVDYQPGIDASGNIDPRAENIECILAWAVSSDERIGVEQIRFQVSPHSKRPMVRFLCYVDAVRDCGFGDGETAKELQIAMNDTFNLSAYRTQMATKLSFKGRRWSHGLDENINLRPDKAILLENIDDLQEFKIMDDIQGGVVQLNTLGDRLNDVMATGPNARGIGGERKETATVGAIMDRRASIRIGLKSTTLEFVGFTEFYDMLLTLCNDFMLPQTLMNIIGSDLAQFYNPNRDDKFIPVSEALETEESKSFKIKMWDQILGRVVAIPNPKTPMVVNYILGQVLELMGGDFKHFKNFMFSEDQKANMLYMLATGSKGGQAQGGSTPNAPGGPMLPTNQTGLMQSMPEQMARGI